MNKVFRWAFACGAFAFALPVHAQNLVQFPTGPAAWTVTIVDRPGAQPPPAALGPFRPTKQIDTVKVDGVSRNIITWADGKTSERWAYDQYHFIITTETPNNRGVAFLSGPDVGIGGQLAVGFDASWFEWVRPNLLKDATPAFGKDCFHYVGTVMARRTGAGPGKKDLEVPLTCEAWVDKNTLQPIALYDGIKLGVYTFHDPPKGPLKAPAIIQREVDAIHQAEAHPLH